MSTVRAKWIIGVAAVVAATLACNLGPANGADAPKSEAETAIALTVTARLQQTEQADVGGLRYGHGSRYRGSSGGADRDPKASGL